MPLVKIKEHYQITLPNSLRKNLDIAIGDYMELENKEGEIVLRPVKLVRPEQEYFYTKEWQKGETEADKDIAEGRVAGPFSSVNDLSSELES
ncbi:MAG TPA: AbrB/MazE/SpoVT family DNA-binding domain-containing protein [Desulfobacterales bacterium]|nr:AbrB/MazE/SpoVT family DNA-binding domain-containing protein [Desulfobacterales bacterium]